jgi:hypothetical protein
LRRDQGDSNPLLARMRRTFLGETLSLFAMRETLRFSRSQTFGMMMPARS